MNERRAASRWQSREGAADQRALLSEFARQIDRFGQLATGFRV
jgi:hypothetical protein